jgi:hypothetical protein
MLCSYVGLGNHVCGSCSALGSGGSYLPRWRDDVAMPDDDFIDRSGTAILRGKLALLNGALDVKVLPLFEPDGHGREIPVERQVVPISYAPAIAVCCPESGSSGPDGHSLPESLTGDNGFPAFLKETQLPRLC